jgi:hypothetical protein
VRIFKNGISCPVLNQCSATADFSAWPWHRCYMCSEYLISIVLDVWPPYTLPHSPHVLVAASHFSNLISLTLSLRANHPHHSAYMQYCLVILAFPGWLTWKVGPIGCPKTLVNMYQLMLCNNPEEQGPQLHSSVSLSNFTGTWAGDFVYIVD